MDEDDLLQHSIKWPKLVKNAGTIRYVSNPFAVPIFILETKKSTTKMTSKKAKAMATRTSLSL